MVTSEIASNGSKGSTRRGSRRSNGRRSLSLDNKQTRVNGPEDKTHVPGKSHVLPIGTVSRDSDCYKTKVIRRFTAPAGSIKALVGEGEKGRNKMTSGQVSEEGGRRSNRVSRRLTPPPGSFGGLDSEAEYHLSKLETEAVVHRHLKKNQAANRQNKYSSTGSRSSTDPHADGQNTMGGGDDGLEKKSIHATQNLDTEYENGRLKAELEDFKMALNIAKGMLAKSNKISSDLKQQVEMLNKKMAEGRCEKIETKNSDELDTYKRNVNDTTKEARRPMEQRAKAGDKAKRSVEDTKTHIFKEILAARMEEQVQQIRNELHTEKFNRRVIEEKLELEKSLRRDAESELQKRSQEISHMQKSEEEMLQKMVKQQKKKAEIECELKKVNQEGAVWVKTTTEILDITREELATERKARIALEEKLEQELASREKFEIEARNLKAELEREKIGYPKLILEPTSSRVAPAAEQLLLESAKALDPYKSFSQTPLRSDWVDATASILTAKKESRQERREVPFCSQWHKLASNTGQLLPQPAVESQQEPCHFGAFEIPDLVDTKQKVGTGGRDRIDLDVSRLIGSLDFDVDPNPDSRSDIDERDILSSDRAPRARW